MRIRERRGQATTEYILLVSFLVSLLMGISGILNSYINKVGTEIESKTSEVMSQRTMGIPLGWFLASTGGKIPDAGTIPVPAGPNGGGNSGANGSGGNNSGLDAGTNSGSGPGGTTSGSPKSPSKSTAGDNAGGGSANAGDSASDSAVGKKGRRRSGGVVEVDDGSDTETTEDKPKTEQQKKEEDAVKKQSKDGPQGAARRSFALTNEEDRRKGSCEDFDMFKMLKILAIAALIVLGGAYLSSAAGNRGGNKK